MVLMLVNNIPDLHVTQIVHESYGHILYFYNVFFCNFVFLVHSLLFYLKYCQNILKFTFCPLQKKNSTMGLEQPEGQQEDKKKKS